MNLFARFGKTKVIASIIVILLLIGGIYYFVFRNKNSGYQFVTVTTGTITEEVSITGNVTPVQSLDLAFQAGGTIASVNDAVGATVNPGDVIASLDTTGLAAQVAQAQADVAEQTAQLQSLQAGAQPADIANSQAALAGGEQTLANLYASISDIMADSFAKANDAVRGQLAPFFSNPESSNPQLTFAVSNSQTLNNVDSDRVNASGELNAWQAELAGVNASSPSSTLDTTLQNADAHLAVIKQLFTDAATALIEEVNLSSSTVVAYKTSLTTGLTEVDTANTNVDTVAQNIASQKIAVQQLQAQLALKLAGSTPQAIAAQEAAVAQAQANVQSAQANLSQGSLVSPITGVVTVQNAKVGEIATPGETLVSIISNNNLEVDADVPEVDIGKVSVGNPVDMTFDAFPNQTFTGKVFFVDPAETVIDGVVYYQIKISFDQLNPQIRSGLTAQLVIKSNPQMNALILPQFAILQNDQGNFVEILQNGKVVQVPVTLGIQDEEGNVQILSGVTSGEQVVNIGLKQGS